jgi:hypothetical protein
LQLSVVQGSPSLHAHGVHAAALVVVLKVPAGHGLHTASLEALAGVPTKVPAGHTLTGVHAAALVVVLKVFAAHALHTRSIVVDGVLLTKVPAGQVAHGAHQVEFGAVENCSLPQAVQLRSVVELPSLARNVPAGQTDLSTHAVAGSPSWSQVPDAQAASGLSPPAQYSPATHAWQTVAEVELPAVTMTVPAAQLPWGRQLDWLSPLEYSPAWQGAHSRSAVDEGVLLT